MKSDIDRLVTELALDAIIVVGDESPNPYRDYLTNRARATGTILKKRGQDAVYVVNAMEREEAARVPQDVGVFWVTGTQLQALKQADLMGAMLPWEYGGMNMPETLYAMMVETLSRAEAGLMTIFGLQEQADRA